MVGAGVLLAGALVVLILQREPPPSFAPTPPSVREAGDRLTGPVTVTIDARSDADWQFFDFSRSSVVERPGPLDWDLAIRRFRMITNGGPGFAGEGGTLPLADTGFDAIREAPADGYVPSAIQRGDSINDALLKWYDYGFTSHILSPKPLVYVVRTADGRYAKLEILGYYCPGATPGCLTIRYVYQGSRSRSFRTGPAGGW